MTRCLLLTCMLESIICAAAVANHCSHAIIGADVALLTKDGVTITVFKSNAGIHINRLFTAVYQELS